MLVQFRVLTFDDQVDRFVQLLAQVPHDPLELGEGSSDRLHPGLQHELLQVGNHVSHGDQVGLVLHVENWQKQLVALGTISPVNSMSLLSRSTFTGWFHFAVDLSGVWGLEDFLVCGGVTIADPSSFEAPESSVLIGRRFGSSVTGSCSAWSSGFLSGSFVGLRFLAFDGSLVRRAETTSLEHGLELDANRANIRRVPVIFDSCISFKASQAE